MKTLGTSIIMDLSDSSLVTVFRELLQENTTENNFAPSGVKKKFHLNVFIILVIIVAQIALQWS